MIEDKYYSGVGSRETPPNVCSKMTKLATSLEDNGYILRSGRARGADISFEIGVRSMYNKRIYTNSYSDNGVIGIRSLSQDIIDSCIELVAKVHSNFSSLAKNEYNLLLHARNVLQVLGDDLKTRSKFTVCWTNGGQTIGGTATAIRISQMFDIPVINMGVPGYRDDDLLDYLLTL
jgi:hypothetical protein